MHLKINLIILIKYIFSSKAITYHGSYHHIYMILSTLSLRPHGFVFELFLKGFVLIGYYS